MGLLLSVLVVCVGVLEAISCVRHVRHGYLPSWASARRPMLHERARNKPSDSSSDDDETANELAVILRNGGGGVNILASSSPSYGLTPILTEHRRNTPILRDEEEESDEEPKYVANNIDECYTGSDNNVLTERFRPISPSDLEDEPSPLDESYVSQTGKFLEVPPDGSSPLQRSSSEETLHDSECEVRPSSGLAEAPCPVEEPVVFQVERTSPPSDEGPTDLSQGADDVIDDDMDMTNDPVFNLVSAAAHILSNEANTCRRSPQLGGSTSSCRPLNVDLATARIPTPQTHRESIPFDLVAAHASSSSRPETPTTPRRSRADISWPVFHPEPVIKRPIIAHTDLPRGDSIEEDLDSLDGDLVDSTDPGLASSPGELPSLPLCPNAASGSIEEDLDSVGGDLVERTDPGLASSPGELPSLPLCPNAARSDSIEEDLDSVGGDLVESTDPGLASSPGELPSLPLCPNAARGDSIEENLDSVDKTSDTGLATSPVVLPSLPLSSVDEISHSSGQAVILSSLPHSSDVAEVVEPQHNKVDVSTVDTGSCVEDQCSKVVARSLSAAPATPFMSIPGGARVGVAPRPHDDVPRRPCRKTSVDKFGRITCEPVRKRRGSLERPEGSLKASGVMSKSLPDFFFEENKAAVTTPPPDADEGVSLGKDITPKESSIKRRRSYREKKRSNWTPSKSRGRDVTEPVSETETEVPQRESPKKSLFEIDNESMDDYTGGSTDSEVVSKVEAIINSALTPVEVLHHSEVRPESGVFATPTQQPKTRLKKPAKAASFEEAGPAMVATPTHKEEVVPTVLDTPIPKEKAELTVIATPTHKEEAGPAAGGHASHTRKDTTTKTTTTVELESNATPVVDVASARPAPTAAPRGPAPKQPHETKPNEDEDDDDDVSASESDTSNINQPQQSSEPAPFWLIFSGEYTKAMSKDWHSGHFCCWQCDESLTGQRYVLRDDHPYCIKCYESVFANMCEECSKTIGIDSKDLSYKDKHWHEACFLCNKCRVSLVDKQFGSKADKIYCSNCYDAQFASRCDGCGEIFRAGTKKMEYKTRQWHEKCFCCCVCKSAIGTKSFIPREQEIYCATCYEEKFATRCVKCNKIITSGGVTYKNEPWHRECFTCTHCNTSLAGQRFTSRDEKPYCAECFGELFAKRCTACVKPITGIGGTRFISFEDRHWHNDCFICASCKTSLVGRGFITDAEDIICPECAKQKLM